MIPQIRREQKRIEIHIPYSKDLVLGVKIMIMYDNDECKPTIILISFVFKGGRRCSLRLLLTSLSNSFHERKELFSRT